MVLNLNAAACWKDGQPAPYLHIARTFSLLDDEKGKIKATSMLCNMFRRSETVHGLGLIVCWIVVVL